MKVLLTTLNAKYIHSNLAIRLLYQLNKSEFPDLDWEEFTIKEDQTAVATKCAVYDVVAFSCYIWNISQTLTVCELIKSINPEVKILLGGPEVSYEWETLFSNPSIDYIITGEGEIPFRSFLEQYPQVADIANLQVRDAIVQPRHSITTNFELVNYVGLNPYQDDDLLELYNKVLYIETSRGCPYKCEFCLASLDNKVRYLPMDQIKANLFFLMNHGRTIKFLDRTFNMKRDFTIEIFQFILDHHKEGNIFQFEITADILHPDIIEFINANVPKGLFRFEIGVQSVNQKANLAVSRKQNFDKTKAIIAAIRDKVEIHLDLIIGLPYDYWQETKESFEGVFELFPPELQMGFLKFLKGTTMRDKEEHGYEFHPYPPYQLISSKYLNERELYELEQIEQVLEIYWNKKRTVHALKYITKRNSIFDFMHRLGSSFETKSNFHRHSLDEVYQIFNQQLLNDFPNDGVLLELLAIDYLLYHKIKPKSIYLEELTGKQKTEVLLSLNLHESKYRYAVLPISFDYQSWVASNEIVNTPNHLIIQFNGREKAMVFKSVSISLNLLLE